MKTFLISSLALNQTKFFCSSLSSYNLYFIVYDTLSVGYLRSKGIQYLYISRKNHKVISNPSSNFNSDIGKFVSHEIINFNNRDEKKLYELYDLVLFSLNQLKFKDVNVIQELGGYVVNKAVYDFARNNSFDHYFIEPSFFKGQLFFIKNSFYFDYLVKSNQESLVDFAGDINIPKKDFEHFKNPFNKLISFHSFERFWVKFWNIYILKHDFYFDDFLGHIYSHLIYFRNSFKLKSQYSLNLSVIGNDSIFFPLHVPGDAALTIREPDFLLQLKTLEFFLKANPETLFFVKEHPARIGSTNYADLMNLLNLYPNLKILNPNFTVHKLSEIFNYAIVVNSKAGAEFLQNGKGVYVLGNVYYSNFVNARFITTFKLTPFKLQANYNDDFDALMRFSHRGELYVESAENIMHFQRAISKLC
jgi:hypothetical protein